VSREVFLMTRTDPLITEAKTDIDMVHQKRMRGLIARTKACKACLRSNQGFKPSVKFHSGEAFSKNAERTAGEVTRKWIPTREKSSRWNWATAGITWI